MLKASFWLAISVMAITPVSQARFWEEQITATD
jgi:hypothetical protein